MCGRFSLYSQESVICEYFGIDNLTQLPKRYNIAPSQDTLIIRENVNGHREGAFTRWGLIPEWTRSDKVNARLINARMETAHEKPSFQSAFEKRRCLVVGDGFYEWQVLPGTKTKQPYYIQLSSQEPMAMAGLWEQWQRGDELIESCSILTRDADAQMRPIHKRMPVILSPEDFDCWLDVTNNNALELHHFLSHLPNPKLQLFKVSTHVNNPHIDDPNCIESI